MRTTAQTFMLARMCYLSERFPVGCVAYLGEAFDVISAAILSPLRLCTSHVAILCKTYVILVL